MAVVVEVTVEEITLLVAIMAVGIMIVMMIVVEATHLLAEVTGIEVMIAAMIAIIVVGHHRLADIVNDLVLGPLPREIVSLTGQHREKFRESTKIRCHTTQ